MKFRWRKPGQSHAKALFKQQLPLKDCACAVMAATGIQHTLNSCISWAPSWGQLQSLVGLKAFSRKQNHTEYVWTSYLGWFWNQPISAALRKDFLHVSAHLECIPGKSLKGQVGLWLRTGQYVCRCCQPSWGSSLWQELGFLQESRGPKSLVSGFPLAISTLEMDDLCIV